MANSILIVVLDIQCLAPMGYIESHTDLGETYSNGVSNTWTIGASGSLVTLTMITWNLETCCDHVHVCFSNGVLFILLNNDVVVLLYYAFWVEARDCSCLQVNFVEVTAPEYVAVLDGPVTITFVTDGSATYPGFKMYFQNDLPAVACPPGDGTEVVHFYFIDPSQCVPSSINSTTLNMDDVNDVLVVPPRVSGLYRVEPRRWQPVRLQC
jgi:hypothetical protein